MLAKHLPLITRLTRQLARDGVEDARNEALRILRERGHVKKSSEELTTEGRRREAMGPAGRAIDRASKQSGHKPSDYRYARGRAVLK